MLQSSTLKTSDYIGWTLLNGAWLFNSFLTIQADRTLIHNGIGDLYALIGEKKRTDTLQVNEIKRSGFYAYQLAEQAKENNVFINQGINILFDKVGSYSYSFISTTTAPKFTFTYTNGMKQDSVRVNYAYAGSLGSQLVSYKSVRSLTGIPINSFGVAHVYVSGSTTDPCISKTYYKDADGDSYGNAAISLEACLVPAGYVANSTDYDDNNAAIHIKPVVKTETYCCKTFLWWCTRTCTREVTPTSL